MSFDKELHEQLCKTYLIEAEEHIASINDALLQAESSSGESAPFVETIYRCVHSLKGGARIVNLSLIEHICQSAESLLANIKEKKIALNDEIQQSIFQVSDILSAILHSPNPSSPELTIKSETIRLRQQLDGLITKITASENSENLSLISTSSLFNQQEQDSQILPEPAEPEPIDVKFETPLVKQINRSDFRRKMHSTDTVRVSAEKLDDLLLQAEEMMTLKLAYREHIQSIKLLTDSLRSFQQRVTNDLFDSSEKAKLCERNLENIIKETLQIKRGCDNAHRQASGLIETLIQDAKALLMFPFSSIAQGFTQSVRQIAQELNKDIEFRLSGETLELDRRILQSIKDPLIHLLRNSIDHGVETIDIRRMRGKRDKATIQLSAAYTDNGKAEITLSDDGQGIDYQAIRKKVIALNLMPEAQANLLNDSELLPFIFRSGFSSKAHVTHISGRGIGMAIVQEHVEQLGGSISIESKSGVGTTFRLILPLTLASFRGIQIRSGRHHFAIPTLSVNRVLRLPHDLVQSVEGRISFCLDKRIIPVVSLTNILGIPCEDELSTNDFKTLMLLGSEHEQIAFEIDEIIGEDDLLLKSLGPQLIRVKNISGATVLGDGSVLPILNTRDLIRSAQGNPLPLPLPSRRLDTNKKPEQKRILIADDSITSRTLLKNVLESYGYEVRTAVDGANALEILQNEPFDLLSSDVEMPHIDGFELTAKIRADEKLSGLPVILVTSLESQQDKERGVEVGADAYIVKSSFDQSNLLEVIRKFI